MNGRKFYVFVLVSMTLLAALGFWTMIDGAYRWHHRPRLETRTQRETLSHSRPFAWEGDLWAQYVA